MWKGDWLHSTSFQIKISMKGQQTNFLGKRISSTLHQKYIIKDTDAFHKFNLNTNHLMTSKITSTNKKNNQFSNVILCSDSILPRRDNPPASPPPERSSLGPTAASGSPFADVSRHHWTSLHTASRAWQQSGPSFDLKSTRKCLH